jgi:HSP20 family molecular chaperone IbpA
MPNMQVSRAAVSRLPFVSTLTRDLDDMQSRLRQAFNLPATDPFVPSLVQPLGYTPAVEITESPESFVVTVELPGLAAKDVSADFEDGLLTIKGEKAETKTEKDKKFYLWERSYGAFERSFSFPTSVDQDAVKAVFENGVLTVTLPKTAEAKGSGKKIDISTR